MPSATASTTNSGIRKLDNGDSVIPASTRADGSMRREIRVKAGYRPPEDVEVYKNRTAEAWKNRGKAGVPGAEAIGEAKPAPHNAAASAVKNAKRREARKKAATNGKEDGNDLDDHKTEERKDELKEAVDPEVEAAKEAKKLAKKLRQARELKDKKDNGDNLLPEQFTKVIKIQELIRQLDALGFDTVGDKKTETKDHDPCEEESASH